jgi:hypothetical protein
MRFVDPNLRLNPLALQRFPFIQDRPELLKCGFEFSGSERPDLSSCFRFEPLNGAGEFVLPHHEGLLPLGDGRLFHLQSPDFLPEVLDRLRKPRDQEPKQTEQGDPSHSG